MPSAAGRRRPAAESEESEEEKAPPTQRRRRAPVSDDESEEDEAEEEAPDEDMDGEADSQDQVVKKLVRYALACEYQRIPIKRIGISEKVLGKQRGSFKRVFDQAQKQLRTKFGMEMVELPSREKITLKERRAAQKTKGGSKSTSSYVLTTILPTEYRSPDIMPPSIISSSSEEATYVGLCTVIVSVIALSDAGQIENHKLKRYLHRMNIDENTPLDKTDITLARMQKHGYIVKVVDKSSDEESIDWRVGPRGKVEIGNKGIQGLVNEVYRESAPDDLETRLHRSLGIEVAGMEESSEEDEPANPGPSTARRTSGRRRRVTTGDE